MIFLILGKPLVFWLGLATLCFFIYQMYLGYRLTHGGAHLFKAHKVNSIILSLLIVTHVIFGFLLYL